MNPLDQASGLRARMDDLRRRRGKASNPPVVAVASGKGGVGKTLLAANLALALRELGRRVLLVDLDPGLADADILLGVHPPVTLEECIASGRPVREAVMAGPQGVLLLPGASGLDSLAEPEGFARAGLWRALEELAPEADVILFDTGAGISPAVLDPLGRARQVVLLTSPEPAAITDAYALLKLLLVRSRESRVGLVVNRAASQDEAFQAATRLTKVADRFLGRRPDFLGWLPESPEVAASARSCVPFFLAAPSSAASGRLRALASGLLAALDRAGLEAVGQGA